MEKYICTIIDSQNPMFVLAGQTESGFQSWELNESGVAAGGPTTWTNPAEFHEIYKLVPPTDTSVQQTV